jgi:NDP-sugar pyrophosphorylase family protein
LTRPKHLLPIANRPHIDRVLELLVRHGVGEVILTTSYLADAFAETVARARSEGLTVEIAHEPEARGTAGAIKNAEPFLGRDRFLVLNADVLTSADLGELVRFHIDRSAEATILLTAVEDPSAFGVVPTDTSGRVTGFIEKPPPGEAPTNLINAGVYVMEPSVLDRIPEGAEWSAERALFPEIVEAGSLYANASDAYWMDVGTPAKYIQANVDAVEGRFEGNAAEDRQGGVSIHPSATVSNEAEVSSSSIGAGAVIGRAVVERSVLLDDVQIADGATVRNSVLGERVYVGPSIDLDGVTAGDGQRFGED